MANRLYNAYCQRLLHGQSNWLDGNRYCFLLTSAYVFDENHVSLSDIPLAARIAYVVIPSREIGPKGWACSLPILFPALTGPAVASFVFTSGTSESSNLGAYFDDAIELPFQPNGSDFYLLPSSRDGGGATGSGGWFRP